MKVHTQSIPSSPYSSSPSSSSSYSSSLSSSSLYSSSLSSSSSYSSSLSSSSPYSSSRSSSFTLLTQHSWPSQGGTCPVVGVGFSSLVAAVSLVRAAPLPAQQSLRHETPPPPAAAGGTSMLQPCDSAALKAEGWKPTIIVLENCCRGTWRVVAY